MLHPLPTKIEADNPLILVNTFLYSLNKNLQPTHAIIPVSLSFLSGFGGRKLRAQIDIKKKIQCAILSSSTHTPEEYISFVQLMQPSLKLVISKITINQIGIRKASVTSILYWPDGRHPHALVPQ